MFKAEIIGNLGADAEVRTSNGVKFVTFRLADTVKFTGQDGKERETTQWIDVSYNNAESKLLPYLKQGVKVFVRGNVSTRVYSSPKDRMMKAGIRVSAIEIELCGGSNETVPRLLIDPQTNQTYNVSKWYWIDRDNKKMKKEELLSLVDRHGELYVMNKEGFVSPMPQQTEDAPGEAADVIQNDTQTA